MTGVDLVVYLVGGGVVFSLGFLAGTAWMALERLARSVEEKQRRSADDQLFSELERRDSRK